MRAKCYDVCIYGSGAAAAGAALTCVQYGLSTVLVSPNGFVCSESANAFLGDLTRGVSQNADSLALELLNAGAYREPYADVCVLQLRLLRRLEKADILYYARPAGFAHDGDEVKGVSFATKNGLECLCAKCFMDLSDDLEMVRVIQPELRREPTGGDTLFVFNMELDEPLSLKDLPQFDDMTLGGSLWSTELVVKLKNGTRLSILPALKKVRALGKVFQDAIVTRASNSPVKLSRSRLAGKPAYRNIFASKSTHDFSFEDHGSLISTRMLEGEQLVEHMLPELRTMQYHSVDPAEVSVILPSETEPCDVLVCGGGTAGAFAALAAARSGAKTVLWEGLDYLGGIGTGGNIPGYYYGTPGGMQTEIDARVTECTRLLNGRHALTADEESRRFHPLAKMIVLEEQLCAAGVQIAFNKTIFGVKTTDVKPPEFPVRRGSPQPPVMHRLDRVEGISADGISACAATVFIDSTGDGDVAVAAGAKYTAGRDPDAVQHIFSVPAMFLDEQPQTDAAGKEVGREFRFWTFNIDAGYADACDPWDVSRARRIGLLGFDHAKYGKARRLQTLSTVLGVRASRQILGDYKLTLADQIRSSRFNDVIAYSASHYDNHSNDYENESMNALLWSWALDCHDAPIGCEIPYSIMLPLGVENLLIACRALSLDFDANLQFRMMRDMQRIGEAAGYAAATAVADKVAPRYIDVSKIQRKLLDTKALSNPGGNFHSSDWKPQNFYPDRRVFELTGDGFKPSQRMLPESVHQTRDWEKAIRSSDAAVKYGAALKLATGTHLSQAEALLPECIKSRCAAHDKLWWSSPNTPYWKIAIAVCNANKIVAAKDVIEDVLSDEDCLQDQQALILAVRALGEIGDAHSARAIETLLLRGDVAHTQEFPYWCSEQVIRDDSAWKLELAAYEAMYKLGVQRKEYLDKSLNDERGYVRRAAERVKIRTEAMPVKRG